MKYTFQNKHGVECIFTDEGVTFYGAMQEVFYPFGSIDTINLSLLGVLQVAHRSQVCSFAVERGDRARVKELVRNAKAAMKTAPKAEVQFVDLTQKSEKDVISPKLPPEEQLKQYKAQFIQGILSKEEYDLKKRRLKG